MKHKSTIIYFILISTWSLCLWIFLSGMGIRQITSVVFYMRLVGALCVTGAVMVLTASLIDLAERNTASRDRAKNQQNKKVA